MLNEIFHPTSKNKVVTIKVDGFTFTIHPYCYKKVEMTENMKFRIKCKENPAHNREFDDIKEMTDFIGQFIYMSVIDRMI